MKLPIYLQPLLVSDYSELIKLWNTSDLIEAQQTVTPEALKKFLHRNSTNSFAAYSGSQLIGYVLAGHDGWQGYLHHLAIKPNFRECGIGVLLVNAAVGALKRENISKVHILIKPDNMIARQFWTACNFKFQDGLLNYSLIQSDS